MTRRAQRVFGSLVASLLPFFAALAMSERIVSGSMFYSAVAGACSGTAYLLYQWALRQEP